jgi:lipopolysaccharide/colanic/teichoic acid biosynthesis glycosyltransferase
MKRMFDFIMSFFGVLILSPLLILLAFFVVLESKGGVFYIQKRVGQFGKPFSLIKLRTMALGSDKKSFLTVGARDSRITKVGYYLRKYKLDELPQLFNIINGDMSLVGPRPEVSKYIDMYVVEDKNEILSVKPGITSPSSLSFIRESEILNNSINPEETYITTIMPQKIKYDLFYVREQTFWGDFKIICNTIFRIFKPLMVSC